MNTVYEDDAFSALVVGPGVYEAGQSDVPAFVADQPMILPQWFEKEMVRLWTTAPRNNVVNDSLISEWLSIAKTFTTAMNDRTQRSTPTTVRWVWVSHRLLRLHVQF